MNSYLLSAIATYQKQSSWRKGNSILGKMHTNRMKIALEENGTNDLGINLLALAYFFDPVLRGDGSKPGLGEHSFVSILQATLFKDFKLPAVAGLDHLKTITDKAQFIAALLESIRELSTFQCKTPSKVLEITM